MDITEFLAARYAEDRSVVPSAAKRAAQVLREIEAKRRGGEQNWGEDLLLKLLAAPYSNHPDFDPAWRVDG